MEKLKEKIKQIILKDSNKDKIWSTKDFPNLTKSKVSKALQKLSKEHFIKRACRGFYYVLRETILGENVCNEIELAIAKIKNKCNFYCVLGYDAYNALGFTTQVSNITVIACNCRVNSFGKIRYIYKERPINGGWAELIVLEAIANIKNISDANPESIILKIKDLIRKNKISLDSLVETSFFKPPRVRCVVGAIAEEFLYDINILSQLHKTIRKTYRLKLKAGDELIYSKHWYIN